MVTRKEQQQHKRSYHAKQMAKTRTNIATRMNATDAARVHEWSRYKFNYHRRKVSVIARGFCFCAQRHSQTHTR